MVERTVAKHENLEGQRAYSSAKREISQRNNKPNNICSRFHTLKEFNSKF